jgi:hypothetical protein
VTIVDTLPTGRRLGLLNGPCDHSRNGERGDMGEIGDWISGTEAAEIMGVHRNTVLRSLQDDAQRTEQWGAENVGWRRKPLSRRGIYQVSAARARELAKQPPPA